LGIESEGLALVTGEELRHRTPVTGINAENPFVGTDMFHACQAMAASPASKGWIYRDTISRLKRQNLSACSHDGTGHLMPHDHARLPSTAFTRKSMDITTADSDCIRSDEQLFGTERRRWRLLN
jgi:hypothetical protein